MRGEHALIPATILTWGFFLFITKLSVPHVGVFEFNFVLYTAAAVIFYLAMLGRSYPQASDSRRSLLYPIAAAGTEVGANISFLSALGLMPVSIVAPAMSTYVLVTVFLAVVFLRERQTAFRSLGMALAVLGVSLLTMPATSTGAGAIGSLGIVLLVLTILLRGAWNFIIKVGISAIGLHRLTKRWLILSALFSAPPLLFSSSSFVINNWVLYPILGAGLMVFGSLAYFAAMKRFPLGIVAPAISLGPGVTVVLAVAFLGESLTIFQCIGAGVALLGVALLAR